MTKQKTIESPVVDAGFVVHGVTANRRLPVRTFIRNPYGMSFLIGRSGKIYSPDLKSGAVYSSQTHISPRTLAALLKMRVITEEEARAHEKSRRESDVWQALLEIEEIERRHNVKVSDCKIENVDRHVNGGD